MERDEIAGAAALVAEARLGRRRLGALAGLATLEDGYDVQRRANDLLEERLGPRVGHKIGGTTVAMRAYIGVPEPVGGEVFATTVHAGGATLALADHVRPGVETEIAVRLGADLPARGQPYAREEVAAAVDAVMASVEVVDDRYEDFRALGPAGLVADNAFNAAVLLGPPVRDLDPLATDRLRARTLVGGKVVAEGLGEALLGHPMDALAWLADRRSSLGLGLEAGAFVTLGSITPVQWVEGPGSFRIEVEGLGAVEVAFA